MRTIEFTTEGAVRARDVTDLVLAALADQVGSAFAWIATPHTSAALILCESDAEMLRDVERVAAGMFEAFEPFEHRRNDNPNAAAHLVSSLMGTHLILPVSNGELRLGTWQRIVFVELDGPKSRRIDVLLLAAAG